MSEYILTADGQIYHADYYNEELYHYGVKGMKWGHRKASYAAEKDAYKSARKNYKRTVKANRRDLGGMGIEGLKRASKAEKRINKAEIDTIDAKAKYKAAKSKNSEKAEFNTYRKEMSKSGLVGSARDRETGGRSTRLYNHLVTTKGKEYADSVQKKVQNVAYAQLAGSVAVMVGATVAQAILENR